MLSDKRGETTLSVFEGDIRNADLLRRACQGASIIFHTASLSDVTGRVDESELHGVNVKGTEEQVAVIVTGDMGNYYITRIVQAF